MWKVSSPSLVSRMQESEIITVLITRLITDRKSKVERKNREVIAECQASLTSMSNQLEARMIAFASTQDQFTLDLSSQLQEFRKREEEKLRGNRDYVLERIQELQAVSKQSGDDQKQSKRSVDGLVDEIRRKGEALVSAAEDRNEELRQICQRLTMKVVQSNKDALSTVKQSMEEMAEMHLASLKVSREQLTQDRKALEEVQSSTQEAMQRELAKVKEQNSRLQVLLSEEKEKSNVMKDKLMKNIGQMLTSFTQERQDNMESAFNEIQQSNTTSQEQVQTYAETQASRLEALLESNRASKESVKEKEKAAKAQRLRFEAGISQGSAQLEGEMQAVSTEVCSGSKGALQDLQETIKDVQTHSVKMRDIIETSRQAQEKQLSVMKDGAEEAYSTIQGELQSTMEDVQETCEGVIEGVQDHCSLGSTFLQESTSQVTQLRENARDYLSSKVQVDVPTNLTPKKREYPHLNAQPQWSLVPSSRKEALRREKKRKLVNGEANGGSSSSVSTAGTDESETNLDDDEDMDREVDDLLQAKYSSEEMDQDGDAAFADETLTKARINVSKIAVLDGKKKPLRAASMASVPLREVNVNRLSIARSGAPPKIRQPSNPIYGGTLAKRQRQ
jgi:kinesin family protein 11